MTKCLCPFGKAGFAEDFIFENEASSTVLNAAKTFDSNVTRVKSLLQTVREENKINDCTWTTQRE